MNTFNKPLAFYRRIPLLIILLGGTLIMGATTAQELTISLSPHHTNMENYAAKELARYLHTLTGTLPSITTNAVTNNNNLFILGRPGHPMIDQLISNSQIKISPTNPGPQGYLLKKIQRNNQSIIVIAANDTTGVLYGVYGFLEEHMGINFSFDGDVLPLSPASSSPPPPESLSRSSGRDLGGGFGGAIDEVKTPAMAIRGFLPWTNFPQSATSYSWEDWTFILDQMARLRMNFLHIHNYTGEEGHNEMFHNFEVAGKLSRVWMATARSGHAWGSYPGWEVNKYPFGSAALFDDYDFGADCALHNEKLDNKQVFRKGVNEFQRVIEYAHKRGIKIGLGLDINLIHESYQLPPDDPRVIAARVQQIATDYPGLDYLLCFQSESLVHEGAEKAREQWRTIFDAFYHGLKKTMPRLRLAVAGWGLRAEDVSSLPKDVICAPISKYSDAFEDGHIYKDHEYWGCPWLERDFYSSTYYYPYNMHLSNTIRAWQERSPNMKGFYSLTWRITDAVKAKMWFMARAPWDDQNKLNSATTVYRQFATQQYGAPAAALVTPIINQNEPFASDFSECRWTPPFSLAGVDRRAQYLFNLHSFKPVEASGNGTHQMAVNYAKYFQARKAPGPQGQEIIGYVVNGSWLAYDNVSFTPSTRQYQFRVSSATDGGRIELRLDTPDGPLIGEKEILPTGSWNEWKDVTVFIEPPSGTHTLYLLFKDREPVQLAQAQLSKANQQLSTIDSAISLTATPGQQYRLRLLRSRIAATRDHILLNLYASNRAHDIAAMARSWVSNFNSRVSDISSLGNVVSVQNRFIQNNYRDLGWKQLNSYMAIPPENVEARGTQTGARLYWQTDNPNIRGFFIYRDGKKINNELLPAHTRQYEDKADGQHAYEVHPVCWGNDAELPSISVPCLAGNADAAAPQIVIISPPTSVLAGQSVWIKARLLDNRSDELLTATLYYRSAGTKEWKQLPMTRRVKAVFTAAIPATTITEKGIDYYISATDGSNTAVFPADAPSLPLSLVQEKATRLVPSLKAPVATTDKYTLKWQPVKGAFYYRIYRSQQKECAAGPENNLTYIAADAALTYTDNGQDLRAQPLTGAWYYRITAVDRQGYESLPSAAVAIHQLQGDRKPSSP
ncbi:carbohydrate-binding protein [Pseudoflavitalea sp. X16]|uniref:carbohydrate-binding protein n=1 Tax=Paraflavitalea devenefica TaxID=2716334 RepID=UPI00141D7D00|nr:carbohydrate-binding protein [Paraflavitalea devenefica]NII25829.1 carbohydrate-binding protein [Paraflavitalea devenefica]